MDALPFIKLFAGKTSVTFIHAQSGKIIGKQKVNPGYLPEAFTRPTSIEFNGSQWRVVNAEPIKDYTLKNKLTLHLLELDTTGNNPDISIVPTIYAVDPIPTTYPLYDDFILPITKEQWRQIEFFPTEELNSVQKDMALIESIVEPEENNHNLSGYKNIHVRHSDYLPLNISLAEFCDRFSISQKGACGFGQGFIENSFALQTENYLYYGVVEKEVIRQLCILEFDSMDEEIHTVISLYDLLLADWCNARAIYL